MLFKSACASYHHDNGMYVINCIKGSNSIHSSQTDFQYSSPQIIPSQNGLFYTYEHKKGNINCVTKHTTQMMTDTWQCLCDLLDVLVPVVSRYHCF